MNRFLGAFAVLIACSVAAAQPLANRVPADAMVYVGWSGTQNVPGYAGSHAEALMKESNIPAIFRQVLPQVIERVRKEDAEAATHLQLVYEMLAPIAKYPTAYFFSGVIFEGEKPMPRLGLVCRAGADAEAIRAKLQGLIDQGGDSDVPVKVITAGQDVAVLVGYSGELQVLGGDGPKPLSGEDRFKSSMAQVQADSAVCFFADFEQIFALIDKGVQFGTAQNPEEAAQWNELYPKVMESFGLRGLKRVAASGGFDGKDWMSRLFVDAPAPRTGLLALMDGPEISNDLLKAVPTSAQVFGAGSFDVAKLISEIRTAIGKVNPEWQKFVDQGLGAATMALGRNFLTDVMEPLGPHWLAYTAPEVAGGGLPGLVAINKVDDAYKAKSGLMAVSLFASNTATSLLAQNDAPIIIQGKQTKYGDLAINYVAVPVITPCWAMQGDYALFGLYPQSVIGASRQITSAKSSILDNSDYQKLRARLGVEKVCGVSYANLPATAPGAYGALMFISRLVGVADLFGISTPAIVIPPYHVLQEHLSVAGGVTWVDNAGAHVKRVSPFPCAEVLQGSSGMAPAVGAMALQAGVVLPALAKARQQSSDVRSLNNVRQLGLSAIMHANDNQGSLPIDLATAAKHAGDNADHLLDSPIGDAPDGIDYIYLGGDGMKVDRIRNPAEVILIYDAAAKGQWKKTAVVFVDGHAEVLAADQVDAAIEASKAALEEARGN